MDKIILNPKAEHFAKAESLQIKRIKSLAGAIGGFLSNNKPNTDSFLNILVKRFETAYDMPSHLVLTKKNPSRPAEPELIEQISQNCKFAVCAIGD